MRAGFFQRRSGLQQLHALCSRFLLLRLWRQELLLVRKRYVLELGRRAVLSYTLCAVYKWAASIQHWGSRVPRVPQSVLSLPQLLECVDA